MIDFIARMFSYDFFVKAFVVGVLVSGSASILGATLVLKRYSMIGDGLSHVAFGALSVAVAANIAPLWFSVPVVIIAAVLLLRVSQNSQMKGDSLIAIISSSSLAIGLIILSLADVNVDINSYMFGSVLALDDSDVVLSIISSALVLVLFIILYNRIFAVTFDESFARATGTNTGLYNFFIATLTAIVIVVGMRLMGALLISSLVIFPSLTSMRLCKSYRSVTICSVIVGIVSYITGLVLTFVFPLPAGASVVAINLLFFIIFTIISKRRRKPHENTVQR